MGADVTHPAPDQMGLKPSIAAVVASCEPTAHGQYLSQVRIQYNQEKNVIEQIMEMQEITRTLLLSFYRATRQKPQKIIFYRYVQHKITESIQPFSSQCGNYSIFLSFRFCVKLKFANLKCENLPF